MSVLDKLTEGIVNRDLQKEGTALLEKWEKTGLLEGIGSDAERNGMARLLENQAKELLREASTMSGGDVEGFAAVAFPIVRRVFGSLIANDLVSVQPMSLPSGLIFFLDFQRTSARLGGAAADSLYGGGVTGMQLTGGVDLGDSDSDNSQAGPYALNNGYSSPTGSSSEVHMVVVASGVLGGANGDDEVTHSTLGGSTIKTSLNKLCQFDPDLSGSSVIVMGVSGSDLSTQIDPKNLTAIAAQGVAGATDATDDAGGGTQNESFDSTRFRHVRRLTRLAGQSAGNANQSPQSLDINAEDVTTLMVFTATGSADNVENLTNHFTGKALTFTFPIDDNLGGTPAAGSAAALGAVVGTTLWDLEAEEGIPEIDIKVDSVSVTAQTKKLKAKWTPELGQDLNAYHNLDAEVELTGILSEQIALEIDRELLTDLVKGATASTYYWSRRPGKFLNRTNGLPISDLANESLLGADFTGTVSEWYETLIETINDVSAQIHRKTLRGGANFVVCSPEVANILEFTSGFRADVTGDADRGTVGAVKTGNLSKKWDVYVDPYFIRNVVLVGRKGGSFLESGYVYAPYVPLQVTPTIFGVEDFVPRKGVMTRYAKKMVRPDMYGLVICTDLLG